MVQASGDKALFAWRPVPPSSAFVAMGMVVTTTEEPPPQDSISCVPRRWVVESTFKPIKVTQHASYGVFTIVDRSDVCVSDSFFMCSFEVSPFPFSFSPTRWLVESRQLDEKLKPCRGGESQKITDGYIRTNERSNEMLRCGTTLARRAEQGRSGW